MKKTRKTLVFWLFCVALIVVCAGVPFHNVQAEESRTSAEQTRSRISLNENWKFKYLGADTAETPGTNVNYDVSGWSTVTVPHTWNNLDAQDGGGNYARGRGWYRKNIEWDASYTGKQIYIEFYGANQKTDVYVNGQKAGDTHKGGYTAFRYDITSLLKEGENVIAVRTDNSYDAAICPLNADFNFYGGMYRDVNLLVTEPVHIDAEDMGSGGLYLTTTDVSEQSADLEVRAKIVNDSAVEKEVKIRADLAVPDQFDAIGEIENPAFSIADMTNDGKGGLIKTVEETVKIAAGGSYEFRKSIVVDQPHLWNGLEDPFRYLVNVTVSDENGAVDVLSDYVGFRYYEVDPEKGFFLNGKSYPLRGVNRHQNYPDLGSALTNQEQNEDFGIIYELGANTLRLCHYPHSDYFYDLCDQYGIVVWAEIPFVNAVGTGETFIVNTENQLKELIRQQYNHPAICFWGLQNEVGNGGSKANMSVIMKRLNDVAHAEDPTRLTTQATNQTDYKNWPSDIVAWNIYPGWYGNFPKNYNDTMDDFHAAEPRAMGISEYGAGGNPFQHQLYPTGVTPYGEWHPEEYQNQIHEEAIECISEREWLWGTYVWAMFDFAVDNRAEGGTVALNDKGLVSYDRQVKKDSFYLYKANWNKNESFTYITGRRNTERVESNTYVKIYSNCDSVKLVVNGKETGTVTNSGNGIFNWENVQLQLGENIIQAVGTKDGKTYEDTVTWTRVLGKVAQLESGSKEIDVSNEQKTVSLAGKMSVDELREGLFGKNGASYEIYDSEEKNPVTEGQVIPGMKIKVTSEDGKQTDVYTVKTRSISAGKVVVASSNEAGNLPSNAVDANAASRWTAVNDSYPQWLQIDLGAEYNLDEITVDWYQGASDTRVYKYRVQISRDGTDYTDVVDRSNNTQGRVVTDSLNGSYGRYVRLYVTGCTRKGSYASCFEVDIQGWKLDSDTYVIDDTEKSIYIKGNKEDVLGVAEFMEHLKLTGNAEYTVKGHDDEAVDYLVTEDSRVIVTSAAGSSVYRVHFDENVEKIDLISENKDVYFSAEEKLNVAGTERCYGKYVNDGNLGSRWTAPQIGTDLARYPEWIAIDLGKSYHLKNIELYLHKYGLNERSYRYKVYAVNEELDFSKFGNDLSGENLTCVADMSENTSKAGHHNHDVDVKARYVIVEVTGCDAFDAGTTFAAAGIYELKVYGSEPEEETPVEPEDPELPYVDVDKETGGWYYDAVSYSYVKNIMTGIDPTHFAPGATLVRAQVAVIIHRMAGEPEITGEYPFADGKQPWFEKAVTWAAGEDVKVITGYTGTDCFGPADEITRSQLAVMLYRYAKYKGYDVTGKADYSAFTDVDDLQPFAVEGMNWAVANGIVTGKDLDKDGAAESLQPQGSASRAECAVMIQRFMENYEK